MITFPPGDDFYYTIEQSAQAEAEKLGMDLEVQKISSYSPAAQVPVVNAAIAKHPDAIIVSATDQDALQAPLEKAADEGIEIILYDTSIRDPSIAATFVSAVPSEMGKAAAEEQVRMLSEEGGEPGGKLFYQFTFPGNAFQVEFHDAWAEVMKGYPDIENLPLVYSEAEPSKAGAQMEAILAAHPDVAGGYMGIFLDQQAMVPALERADVIDQVKTIGLDGAPQNADRVRNGQINALISTAPVLYGIEVIQSADKAIDGEELPPETVIKQCILTQENIDDPENADCLYDKDPAS